MRRRLVSKSSDGNTTPIWGRYEKDQGQKMMNAEIGVQYTEGLLRKKKKGRDAKISRRREDQGHAEKGIAEKDHGSVVWIKESLKKNQKET